jgi:hypothetical protein
MVFQRHSTVDCPIPLIPLIQGSVPPRNSFRVATLRNIGHKMASRKSYIMPFSACSAEPTKRNSTAQCGIADCTAHMSMTGRYPWMAPSAAIRISQPGTCNGNCSLPSSLTQPKLLPNYRLPWDGRPKVLAGFGRVIHTGPIQKKFTFFGHARSRILLIESSAEIIRLVTNKARPSGRVANYTRTIRIAKKPFGNYGK